MQETTKAAAPNAQRVIKKYPNRRLYDTDTSSYITLAEVKQLVMGNEPVVVKDAKTGEDLTRSILLQIILEEEAGGAPMFSEAVLANIIRFYGHAMQGYMGSYLEKNVQMFSDFLSRHRNPRTTGPRNGPAVRRRQRHCSCFTCTPDPDADGPF
jgi:polyhydroxyalkanoate synthesis repressor PhaR